MAKSTKTVGGLDAKGCPQFFETSGAVITPVEGFSSDAGLGKPPAPYAYGKPSDGEFPSGGKMPGGNGKAMKAFFGSGKPSGGK